MKKILVLTLIALCSYSVFAFELNTLIDSPTAGLMQKGEAEIAAKLYKNNGLVLGTKIGLFPRFMLGVNYGAEQVVGNENPLWHDRVEFNCKLRFLDESAQLPAIALGYDSQGHGEYDPDNRRYDIKSKGAFLVASKNYFFLGNVGFHLGANYSLEHKDEEEDKDINLFTGFDKSIGDMFVLLAEYDTAWNDNKSNMTEGKGFLNAAMNIHFTEYLVLKIAFYDLLQNRIDTEGCDRTLSLYYNMTF